MYFDSSNERHLKGFCAKFEAMGMYFAISDELRFYNTVYFPSRPAHT